MKTVKLLSIEISKHWELIKFAATTADEIDEKDLQPYLIELLHALLSDKAQCWVRIDDNRNVVSILITRILFDKITNKKQLFLQTFYSFQMVSVDTLKEIQSLLIPFAKNEQCSHIIFSSPDEEVWKIAPSFGFREENKHFKLNL